MHVFASSQLAFENTFRGLRLPVMLRISRPHLLNWRQQSYSGSRSFDV